MMLVEKARTQVLVVSRAPYLLPLGHVKSSWIVLFPKGDLRLILGVDGDHHLHVGRESAKDCSTAASSNLNDLFIY